MKINPGDSGTLEAFGGTLEGGQPLETHDFECPRFRLLYKERARIHSPPGGGVPP